METPITILVVDDQPSLVENMALLLTMQGYSVLTANDGIEALAILNSKAVHLIIADIAMPRMNGYQLYEAVRENPDWGFVPFIFLSARGMGSDIRYGKQLGVDDYLVKPVEPEDLLVVVKGKLRRTRELRQSVAQSQPPTRDNQVLTVGRLRLDKAQHRVWLVDSEVTLSPHEFALLQTMAQHIGTVLSPQELVQATHNLNTDPVDAGALIRPLIFSLRRKLDEHKLGKDCIENVRGIGYRLVDLEINEG